jgi:hypothetical protein
MLSSMVNYLGGAAQCGFEADFAPNIGETYVRGGAISVRSYRNRW